MLGDTVANSLVYTGINVPAIRIFLRSPQPPFFDFDTIAKMAETCSAPDGSKKWLTITPGQSIFIVSILGFLPLFVLLAGPKLVFWAGGLMGGYLRKKTAGRKAQILELVENEQREWEEKGGKEKERRDSDEWETVDSYAAGTAKNGEKAVDAEWDGIVGFFHPFWWVCCFNAMHLY